MTTEFTPAVYLSHNNRPAVALQRGTKLMHMVGRTESGWLRVFDVPLRDFEKLWVAATHKNGPYPIDRAIRIWLSSDREFKRVMGESRITEKARVLLKSLIHQDGEKGTPVRRELLPAEDRGEHEAITHDAGGAKRTASKRENIRVTLLPGTDAKPPRADSRPGRVLEVLRGAELNTLTLAQIDKRVALKVKFDKIDLERLIKAKWIMVTEER